MSSSPTYTVCALRWRSIAVLFGVWLLTQFAGIFSPPLLDDADSVHVEAVREMLLRHDYVTLYADGIRYFDKPPLPYWLGATSAKLFGINDWAIRLPLALSVLALTLFLYQFAARISYREEDPGYGDRAGLYSALAFATCVGPYLFTRFYIPDVMVALWLTLCADLTLRMVDSVDKHGRAKWWQAMAFALACAACTLTKGLIGVVFPLGILLGYLLVTAQLSKLLRMRIALGAATFLAAAAPWHWLAAVRNPATGGEQRGWFWFYFINDQINRYLNKRIPRDYDKVPLVLFWALLLAWLVPWGVFLPAVARRGWKLLRLREAPASVAGPRLTRLGIALRSPQTLFVLWALGILLFFSFSTRQEYYTIPAVPPLCLLVGLFLAREEWGAAFTRRAGLWCAAALAVVGTLVAAVCFYFAAASATPPPGLDLFTALQQHPEYSALSFGDVMDLTPQALGFFRLPLLGTGIGLGLGTLFALLLRARRRYFAANVTLAAGMLLVLGCAHRGLEIFYPILGSEPLAEVIEQNWQPEAKIVLDGSYAMGSSLNFYTGEPVYMLNGRIYNLWYGSLFPDAPHRFEDDASFASLWNGPERIFFVVYDAARARKWISENHARVLAQSGGKWLLVNH